MNNYFNMLNQGSQKQKDDSNNLFSHVPMHEIDLILEAHQACLQDQNPNKIDLSFGVYWDEEGKQYVFDAVREAEEIARKRQHNYDYLPIQGLPEFCESTEKFLFGAESDVIKQKKVVTCQSLSGTGAHQLLFQFLKTFYPVFVYLPNQTWFSHKLMVENANLKWIQYPYYDNETGGSNVPAMIQFFETAIPNSLVLFHPCAHNPTGVDLTQDQWKLVANAMKKRNLIPFFDMAYQGYASGSTEEDVWAIRYFAEEGFQLFVSQSFAKSMALYGTRIGALHSVAKNQETAEKIISQIKLIARKTYLNPPFSGAIIVAEVLTNNELRGRWQAELKKAADRCDRMRKLLREELEKAQVPGNWDRITKQKGMFAFTGLNEKQCETLMYKHHVYVLRSGRLAIPGVNEHNVKYLVSSIKKTIEETS